MNIPEEGFIPQTELKGQIICQPIRIKFWVNKEGKIIETNILVSSGFPALDIFVKDALIKWLFKPIDENEPVWGIITFKFRLT